MSPAEKRLVVLVLAIAAAGTLFGLAAFRVAGNLSAINHPPALCQLFGGRWSWWTGWHCG